MAEPLPSDGYGPAAWVDYTNNWRKADTDWMQSRAILRYASGPPASGEVGQTVYDFAADRINMRSKVNRWIPVVAAENLVTGPITSSSPTEGVGFTHKQSSGQGLVFAPNEIIAYQKLRTGGSEVVLDSTGLALQTVGGVAAKLTTDATGLHSSATIVAPVVIADFQALATTNAKALTATSGVFSANVSITGTLGVTGLVSVNAMDITADPASANRAARRSWVEGLVNAKLSQAQADALYLSQAEGDARFINNTGDTITGTFNLTRAGEAPLIQFYNIAGGTRFGYIQSLSTGLTLSSDAANTYVRLLIGGGESFRAHDTGASVTGTLSVSGTAAINSYIYSGIAVRAGGNGGQVQLIDTSGGGYNAYLGYYNGGTTTAPGSQIGYAGFNGSSELRVQNNISAGILRLLTTGAGDVYLQPGVGGEIFLSPNNTFQGKMAGTNFMWGKAAPDVHNVGLEMDGGYGRYMSTTDVAANLYAHHVGANDAANKAFIQFLAGTTTVLLSEIRQNSARNGIVIVNCTTSAPSDYRWKDDLGPVEGALDRVMQLRPRRLRWIESGEEFEGFIAHEAGEVVPYLVNGEKDAITEDGQIEGQGFNYGGETPLLTAALQELAARVTALETAA